MRKFKFLSMAAIAAMMLGACSDDKLSDGPDSPNGPGTETQDGVYFTIDIDLPNAKNSRSQTVNPGDNGSTSNSGVEYGKDYENIVEKAIIILAEAETNNFIAAAQITKTDLHALTADKSTYQAVSQFTKTQLSNYYNKPNHKTEANIFLFCNPTNELSNIVFGHKEGENTVAGIASGSNDWINKIGNATVNDAIWAKSSFLMSNALIATREIPHTLQDWNFYTSKSKPFDLSGTNGDVNIDNGTTDRGAVKVERAVARFDFKDGSIGGKGCNDENGYNGIKNRTYEVVYITGDDNKKTAIVNIQLEKMALINMNKSYYFLRHVSDNGSPTDAQICKPELPWYAVGSGAITKNGNYVVDADYTWKQSVITATKANTIPTTFDYSEGLHYPFFKSDGTIDNNGNEDRWGTVSCEDVLNGTEDNNDSWNSDDKNDLGDYRIWRYVTENTIAGPVESQINAISTGVVFKGKMVAPAAAVNSTDADIKKLADAINNTEESFGDSYRAPILYLFAGNLYLSWPKIREAAIKAAIPGFKWVAVEGETDGGHWEPISINRSNSLYVAVFGTGGFGSVDFKYNVVDSQTGNVTQEGVSIKYTDTLAEKVGCANDAWNKWNEARKPATADSEVKNAFKKAVTDANITIYQRSKDKDLGWGYYCYYYYWNRHNDNLNNGVMGPMEFAVVRNNVYKLAVTKLSQIGHPRISENDPDKPTPGRPDEKEDVYLTVTAQVLPWVVRVNNIEF